MCVQGGMKVEQMKVCVHQHVRVCVCVCAPPFPRSATIANPREHASRLIGVLNPDTDMSLVSEDGSPTGPKQFILWNPPLSFGQSKTQTQSQKGGKRKKARGAGSDAGQVGACYGSMYALCAPGRRHSSVGARIGNCVSLIWSQYAMFSALA